MNSMSGSAVAVTPFRLLLWGLCAGLLVFHAGALHAILVNSSATSDSAYRVGVLCVAIAFNLCALLTGSYGPENGLVRMGCAAHLTAELVLHRLSLLGLWPNALGTNALLYFGLPFPVPVFLAVAFTFLSRFPSGHQRRRLERSAEATLYAGGIVLWVSQELVSRTLGQPRFPRLADPLLPSLEKLNGMIPVFMWVAFLSIVITAVANYRRVTVLGQRRRIKWVAFGTLLGLFPWVALLTLTLLKELFPSLELFELGDLDRFYKAANLATVLIPLVTGYAVARHRLYEIDVVVRQGLQYLLARNVLRTALATPVIVVAFLVYLNRHRTLSELVLQNSIQFYIAAAGAAGLLFRTPLQKWLDRKFFRADYDREQLLMGLTEKISRLGPISEICDVVKQEIAAALHPKALFIAVREDIRKATESGASGEFPSSLTLISAPEILALFGQVSSPVETEALGKSGFSPDALRWLADFGIDLSVPMRDARGQLIGLLLLGERKSEEPYAKKDRELLSTVASQMAIVFENKVLTETMLQERTVRQDLQMKLGKESSWLKECPLCGDCYHARTAVCSKDGATLLVLMPVEKLIDERYMLIRRIGSGGMGAVYEGWDTRLGREVAIKIVVGNQFRDRDVSRRFEREAMACAKLNHPNIVSVFDYGTLGQQGAYLVMEHVKGVTLRNEMKARGRIPPQEAADWFDQVAEGMKAAHSYGVVHRDLKPENVLLDKNRKPKPLAKVLDFGLAKASFLEWSNPNSLTAPGMAVGTVGYMSPEQISGDEADHRSDIFSLGVMVYESLTGSLPFKGESVREMMFSALWDPVPIKAEGQAGTKLARALEKCLAKNRHSRYQFMQEVQEELIPALRGAVQLELPVPETPPEPNETDSPQR